jgi:uncharacterized protein (TIGR02271 family)
MSEAARIDKRAITRKGKCMSYEKVVALYDTDASARAAVKTLRSAGYSADDISIIQNESDAEKAGLHHPGVWQRLFGHDLEHHEAAVLSRSLREGSAIVSVRVSESEAPKVISLLDSHKPVDVLDRARTYGLMGTPPTSKTFDKASDEQVVRLAEEQLNVGKRVIDAGLTRVRRVIVEKPVEANVTLHEEHVEIMRRAISEPGYGKDIDWSDKTIEVSETAEEAVIDKTARITEEVVIRRTGSDHVQTVRDTVRRQQVDVERIPVGAGAGAKIRGA